MSVGIGVSLAVAGVLLLIASAAAAAAGPRGSMPASAPQWTPDSEADTRT